MLKTNTYNILFQATPRVIARYFSSEPSKPLAYYLTVMGVKKNFTQQQLKSAYLELVKKYHPDLSKDSNASQKFQQIQKAYDVLNNPQTMKKLNQQQNSYRPRPKKEQSEQQKRSSEEENFNAKQFYKRFNSDFKRKQSSDDSMRFSYGLYKKHYQKVQQKKKNEYKKFQGHEREHFAHKSQKQDPMWGSIGMGALIVTLISGAIFAVNIK